MSPHFKFILGALALLFCAAAAYAVEFTKAEAETCRTRGGCILVPIDTLREKMLELFEKGHEAGRISCGNRA